MSRAFSIRPGHAGALALAAILLGAAPAHALRVTTWNLLNYTDSPNSITTRQAQFRTVMGSLSTDMIIVQELLSAAAADSFLTNVLQPAQPSRVWKNGGYIPSTQSAVYYDSLTIRIVTVTSVATGGPRDVLIADFRPRGYNHPNPNNKSLVRMYSVHFKAGGPGTPDSTTRRLECTSLRSTVNLLPANTNFILGGDTNFYGDWEGGYIRLTESQADNDGRFRDLLSMPGTWNQIAYRFNHTQSPCLGGCIGSGGGLDDRFDLWLSSHVLNDGQGFDLVPSGYIPYGQDGLHYNDAVDGGGFNNAVGLTIASALRQVSDHLPVILTLQVPAKVVAASALGLGSAIVGGAAQQTLQVSNGAVAPADGLDYSFSTVPAGFLAPGGSFTAAVGSPNNHTIGMSTASAGVKSGTLLLTTDDPDTASKSVLLSGTVLDHAVASLDSSAVVTDLTLDLGDHENGAFRDSSVRVHDKGWNSLRARLSVNTGVITGGAGHFSIVGGFSSALLSGVGKTYTVHFDTTGATPDSAYTATLTFASTDEALPGGTAASDLVVHLRAKPLASTTDAPGPAAALRFEPPQPNPSAGETWFAFSLPARAPVSLAVYDLGGRRVASLVHGEQEAGPHRLSWGARADHGGRVPAGLYFVRFTTRGLSRTARLVVLP